MNRHAFDAVSLVFGIVFLAVVGGWLMDHWVSVRLPSAGWLLAAGLVLLGVVGLITTMRRRPGAGPGQ